MDEPTQPAQRDSDLEQEVLAACIDAWQQGGAAAVEQVLALQPALAAALRPRLEKLERAGLLGPPGGSGGGEGGGDVDASEVPQQLGDFKLGKRLGSGGMGIVYAAEQVSLGRTVALKLVRPELRFFPGARARFRREVEAIARLGDAGIVPIHCVGEDQGIDFFAMEYVRGASLGDVLAAVNGKAPASLAGREVAVIAAARGEVPLPEPLPELFLGTWVQTCCRLVQRMARAVHHAHERGVVHRDLKPNNAMVTADGRVLLLDFGLAAADGTARITRSGAMLGTLHYMAPEQLRDEDVDVRTDVYALGVTLYELLALRPPFDERSQEGLRQAILGGRATRLQQLNPEVPRDVETIVAKATDRDAVRRYASAEAMAADLERFLQHRPIEARRMGVGLRALRWSQRHPAWATALVLSATALLAAPLLVHWTRSTALEQSRSNLESALAGVQGLLHQASSKTMARVPGLDAERLRQFNTAGELMTRLRRENPEDTRVATLFARTLVQLSELRRFTGDAAGAERALDAAEPVLQELRGRVPGEIGHLADIVGLWLARGLAAVQAGRVDEAKVPWTRILDETAKVDRARWSSQLRLAVSSAHHDLARLAKEAGDLDGAIEHMRQSTELETGLDAEGLVFDAQINVVRSTLNLAALLREKGDLDGSGAELERARAHLAKLLTDNPGEPEVRREQARTTIAMAGLADVRGQQQKALSMRDDAVATMTELVNAFPERAVYRQELGLMLHELALGRKREGHDATAEAAEDRAVAGHEKLLAGQADNAEYASQLAVFLHHRGYLRANERPDAAGADFARAAALLDAVAAQRPKDGAYLFQAAQMQRTVGSFASRREDWVLSRQAYERAVALLEAALACGHPGAKSAHGLPAALPALAQAAMMADDFDAVMVALHRLHEVRPLSVADLRGLGEDLHVDDRADFQALLRAVEAGAAGK